MQCRNLESKHWNARKNLVCRPQTHRPANKATHEHHVSLSHIGHNSRRLDPERLHEIAGQMAVARRTGIAGACAGLAVAAPTPVTTLTLAAQPVQRSVVATGRVEAIRESDAGQHRHRAGGGHPGQTRRACRRWRHLLLESDELLALRAQAEAQLRDADSQLSEARRQWQHQQALFAKALSARRRWMPPAHAGRRRAASGANARCAGAKPGQTGTNDRACAS